MEKLWLVTAWEDWDLETKDSFMVVAKDKQEARNKGLKEGYYSNCRVTKIENVDGYDIKLENNSYWKRTK